MNLKILIIAVSCTAWMSCITDDSKVKNSPLAPGQEKRDIDSTSLTTIQWMDSVKQLGNVPEGQLVEVVFRFKNTGSKPLVVESVRPSCGCTVPSKPEEPIMPGLIGEIKAVFNSQGRTGANHKTITVTANTKPSTQIIEFNVNVLGKTDGPKAATPQPTGSF